MEKNIKKEKVIAASATFLLFVSLIGIGLLQQSKRSLNDILSDTKLKTESLLSEKLSLNKQIDKFEKEMAFLNKKNSELNKLLAEANKKFAKKESEIKTIYKDNTKTKSLEKELADIKKIKSDLEKQIAALNINIDQLKADNNRFNSTTALLQDENKALTDNVNILSAMVADNFRIESLKGKKDRLTVLAKKTKKLQVSFDVPQSIITDVNFKITTPQGKSLTSNDESISSTIIENDNGLFASISPVTGEFEVSKRIEMNYKPKEKLTGGIYKIDIYNKDVRLGSCQIKLR